MRGLLFGLATGLAVAGCAQPRPAMEVAESDSETVVAPQAAYDRNVSTTVAVGSDGAGVAVGTGNLWFGMGTGGRGGMGFWF